MKLTIDNKLHANLPTLTATEYAGLEHKILTEGFRDPIVTWAGTDIILDGRNRYNICQQHNITFTTSSLAIANDDAARIWIIDNQANKRNISEFIKFELLAEKQELLMLKAQGKVNMSKGGGDKKSGLSTVDKPDIKPVNTQREIAKELGKSTGHVAKMDYVKNHADSATKDKLRKNEMTSNEAYADIKRQEKKDEYNKRVEAAKDNPQKETFQGPFDLILSDPPWKYDGAYTKSREVENHYNTCTIEEILANKPNSANDSILLLWATAPLLEEALQVMKSWGFEYKTQAVWDKVHQGMGFWFMGQHELLLIGVKGKPSCVPECARVSSVFREQRTKHSKKPECVYSWIEKAFPDKTKLEMYCRIARKGWSVCGNEV